MNRNLTLAAVAAVVLLVLGVVLVLAPRDRPDVDDELAELDTAELPARAEALLATDRPWRAARAMRLYRARTAELSVDAALLSARAEAGYGEWDEVHALLEPIAGLERHEDGIGLFLLGQARDHVGEPARAAEAYVQFLETAPPERFPVERGAARLRLGLSLIRAGDDEAGRRELAAAGAALGSRSPWLSLLQADALAERGDTAATRQAVADHTAGLAGLRGWRARLHAASRAGDPAAVRALADQAARWATTDATRAEFTVAGARAALAQGDEAAARGALRAAIAITPVGSAAREAAALLRAGAMTPADHLQVARVDAAQGLHEQAAEGFRIWLEAGLGTPAERATVHYDHANSLFYAERYGDVEAALRPIADQLDARMLVARNHAHLGDPERAATGYLAIARDHAGTGTAAQALLLAAGAWHDAGAADRATPIYRQLISAHPTTTQAGLARMRLAGIDFLEGRYAEAERGWEEYRTRFPRGELWLQSTYWAGRAREARGDSAGAATRYREARSRQRDSYYALLASRRLGVPFWPLPTSSAPAPSAVARERVAGWMRGVDLLIAAGYPDEASAEADLIVAGAGADRATRYALAEALVARGYSQRAIRIGTALQGTAQPDARVLEMLFPFPYRNLVEEEARERGYDPFIAAALIRQESMFEFRATSPVGARGLMQIMPATGAGLAEEAGIEDFDADMLYHPEINVYLGTRYVGRHLESYDGSLPAVFSAYNAGSHRVEWWSQFPEWGDDELFTERIPFRETRDYVKILTRNLEVYRGLYGTGEPAR